MKQWMKVAALAICLAIAVASPVLAEGDLIEIEPIRAEAPSAKITLRGVLTYTDLEGGFYSVNGWRLVGDQAEFEANLGKVVVVSGIVDNSPSIFMVKAILVSSFEVDPDQSVPDKPTFGVFPVPDMAIPASRPVPGSIVVNGQVVEFDQGPVASDDVLMIPLRFVVEAAGGQVEWDGENLVVTVRMADRVVRFQIGNPEAQIVDVGMTLTITMAKAPELVESRTLVSADALSILGFAENTPEDQGEAGDSLELILPVAPPAEDMKSTLVGVIKEVETGDKVRILVEGEPMMSGEPSLTWVTIFPDTEIFVEENGEMVKTDASVFEAGQTVEVEVEGAIAMSYPALAGASSVVIKK
ncbi:MAG TPA: copper amine oxidase N-terminal domain-containing protein [Firmicutes bacterium]|nr:copper amine oxidase N-terminal domain-containing protein [Candidatus Fermentithermobacillaceae bacterium]